MVRWIDTFRYNGEIAVEVRLEYLYEHVDKFYIIEGRYTHQGLRKDILYFEKYQNMFKPYLDKIVFYCMETYDADAYEKSGIDAHAHAHEQMRYAAQFILNNEEGPYIISVCDGDEIPSISHIESKMELYNRISNINYALMLNTTMFMYNLNWGYDAMWAYPYIINDIVFKQNPDLVSYRGNVRHNNLLNGGFHLAYFLSIPEIIRKLKSFDHRELNKEHLCDPKFIYTCITNGRQLVSNEPGGHSRVPLVPYTGDRLPELFYKYHNKVIEGQQLSLN